MKLHALPRRAAIALGLPDCLQLWAWRAASCWFRQISYKPLSVCGAVASPISESSHITCADASVWPRCAIGDHLHSRPLLLLIIHVPFGDPWGVQHGKVTVKAGRVN